MDQMAMRLSLGPVLIEMGAGSSFESESESDSSDDNSRSSLWRKARDPAEVRRSGLKG